MLIAGLAVAGPAGAVEIDLLRPGQNFEAEARSILDRECTRLILSDNGRDIFITCDLTSGDLITANAKMGGAVYWITYRTGSEMTRPQFVAETQNALGFEGEGTPCGSGQRAADCWSRGSALLQIPMARDPGGRWVAVHEDESLADQ